MNPVLQGLKGPALGTLLGSTTGGTYSYLNTDKKRREKHPFLSFAEGAVPGGFYGGIFGIGMGMGNPRYRGNYRTHMGRPQIRNEEELLRTLGLHNKKAIANKNEVKKHFRDLAMKHHPDRGGDPEMMKKINRAYEDLSKTDWFNKLGFVQRIANLLERLGH